MELNACCEAMALAWTQRVIDHQYADICYCSSCGHVHSTERYPVPMALIPLQGRCINCGGDITSGSCASCRNTEAKSRTLHQGYAKLHPTGDFLEAALALADLGRYTLALKLASAEFAWGNDPDTGEVLRIQTLATIGEGDRALDEAYAWMNSDAPLVIVSLICELELAAGNRAGAIRILEDGLKYDESNLGWWVDYAELLAKIDDRPAAINAAKRGLGDPNLESRCVAVIAEMGERLYANAQFAEALGACSLTADLQSKYKDLAWLRARICASKEDREQTVEWLHTVTELDPDNEQARVMYESFAPPKKQGWFW